MLQRALNFIRLPLIRQPRPKFWRWARSVSNFGGNNSGIAYALTSSFCLPEQGMKDFELLSRASLTIIESKMKHKKYHLVGPAHVTHPWHFRRFYPGEQMDWLNFLREDSVRTEFTIKEPSTGKTLISIPLASKSFRHKEKDLVVLHFADESAALNQLAKHSLTLQALQLEEKTESVKEGDAVTLTGHELFTSTTAKEEVMLPVSTSGEVNVWHRKKGFIRTPSPVPMGMCGGPILNRKSNKCIGVVEALVHAFDSRAPEAPKGEAAEFYKRISLNAVCLPADDIRTFLKQIEEH